jgi:hypothetical protein
MEWNGDNNNNREREGKKIIILYIPFYIRLDTALLI